MDDAGFVRLDFATVQQVQGHGLPVRLSIALEDKLVCIFSLKRCIACERAVLHTEIPMVVWSRFRWKKFRADKNGRVRECECGVLDEHIPYSTGFEPERSISRKQERQFRLTVVHNDSTAALESQMRVRLSEAAIPQGDVRLGREIFHK